MKVVFPLTLLFLPIFFTGLAHGQEKKSPPFQVAVVDLTRVFEHHPRTASAVEKLTEERDASRKRFADLTNKLKAVLQKHQELIRAKNKDEAVEALKVANELEREIATLGTTEKRDLEEKFRKQKNLILGDIRGAVARFNKSGKFAIVFDSSSLSPNGLPPVLHAPGAVDVTDDVIALLKEEAEARANAEKKNDA